MPGEATLKLPAGTVKLRYQVSIRTATDDPFRAPPELDVTIVGAGGEAIPIERTPPAAGASSARNAYLGYVRAPIGQAEIDAAGDYTVTAGPAPPPATPDHTNPLVLVGR